MDIVKRYQKQLSLIIGVFFILLYIVLYFWDNKESTVLSENEIAARNIARMEARMDSDRASAGSSEKYKRVKFEHKDQSQSFLILLLLFGVGLSGYGYIKK